MLFCVVNRDNVDVLATRLVVREALTGAPTNVVSSRLPNARWTWSFARRLLTTIAYISEDSFTSMMRYEKCEMLAARSTELVAV